MLPYSTRYVIDSVVIKHHTELLRLLVLGILGATSHTGTHVVFAYPAAFKNGATPDRGASPESAGACGEAADRISRLHEKRRAGFRIMNDVEGVRNLI